MISPDKIACLLLRRAAEGVKKSAVRRYFVPRFLPVKIDLNHAESVLFSRLADLIESRRDIKKTTKRR